MKMSFSTDGTYQIALQQYKFGEQKICCLFKIMPHKVHLFMQNKKNNYYWMTETRWALIENALWKMFANLEKRQEQPHDICTNVVIDHMKASIKATTKFLPIANQLIDFKDSADKYIGLEITLKYMSQEDTDNEQLTKHKTKEEYIKRSSSGDKTKTKHTDSSSFKSKPSSRQNEHHTASTRSSRKRERRSVSHGTVISKHRSSSSTRRSRSRSPVKKRSKSPNKKNFESEKPKKSDSKSSKSSSKTSSSRTKSSSTKDKGKSQKLTADNNENFPKVDALDIPLRMNPEALKELNQLMDVPKPREVKILLLKDMKESSILSSFEKYRENFEKLYEERKDKSQTANYMSITHCHIMDILTKTIHDKMITKLRELYSNKSAHVSLVLNGLLPLWIIRIFMDKFNFTEEEAVHQISDQLEYNTYVKAVNNESLSPDLDGLLN